MTTGNTDDLIARLFEESRCDFVDGSYTREALRRLLREAAEALAAASRPSKKDEDLDPRVAVERLPERTGSTASSNEPEVGVQLVEDVYAGLAQDRAPGTPSRSGRIQRDPEVEQGSAVHPAPLAPPAAPPPWQPIETHSVLAGKHAARLRREIAACGCPKPDEEHGGLWCPRCMDREQVATILEALPSPPASAPPTRPGNSRRHAEDGSGETAVRARAAQRQGFRAS